MKYTSKGQVNNLAKPQTGPILKRPGLKSQSTNFEPVGDNELRVIDDDMKVLTQGEDIQFFDI